MSEQILTLLIQERDKLSRAIEALDGTTKLSRRKATADTQTLTADRPKRHVSAASRRKMALAQKKRWAAIKAAT